MSTVFPGILNYHCDNTIALSIWSQDPTGGSASIEWTVTEVSQSSFDPGFDADYLRPGWTDRSDYY